MGDRKQGFFKTNDLAALLLLSIFMNGFESGGYQAALIHIGTEYSLDNRAQGIMASIELFATMIAPLLLGTLADKVGKKIVLVAFTVIRAVSCVVISVATGSVLFAVGIFVLGFATSIIQYVAIAQMMDGYPVSNHNRMGLIAAMYALGAVVAPIIVGNAVKTSLGWKAFFAVDLAVSAVLSILLIITSFKPREEIPDTPEFAESDQGKATYTGSGFYVVGVALLSIIMFIYVGVENGVGFFINGYMHDTMDSMNGYIALSLFWMAMIPSRVLCGVFAKYRRELLCGAPAGAALSLAAFSFIRTDISAFVIVFIMGLFCGAIYPNVLTYASDFAGKKTATVTAIITVATGIGGTVMSAAFGFLETAFGYTGAFLILSGLLALDTVFAVMVVRRAAKPVKNT
ncbi:Fucose permease [Lachnospiraceae bacterium]|nr:Fucose permease [Lachnospiraceae bacterium]